MLMSGVWASVVTLSRIMTVAEGRKGCLFSRQLDRNFSRLCAVGCGRFMTKEGVPVEYFSATFEMNCSTKIVNFQFLWLAKTAQTHQRAPTISHLTLILGAKPISTRTVVIGVSGSDAYGRWMMSIPTLVDGETTSKQTLLTHLWL